MKRTYIIAVVVIAVVAAGAVKSRQFFGVDKISDSTHTGNQSTIHSQYVGQETREIKALPQNDIEGLLKGEGTPFGGMAKPAELNGYPGPRHVLDAIEVGEFEITDKQQVQIQNMYREMNTQAIILGKQIVAIERRIDDSFSNKTVTEENLRKNISSSAELYKQLRFLHLKYHLQMLNILTPQQIEQYNTLRGYANTNDPCENIPKGHDSELWKKHNNCK